MRIDGPQITGSFSLNGDGVQDLDVFATTSSLNLATASLATTGSNVFVGTQTISGSIIPAVDNTYDLGSTTHQFRDLYLSSASLYIDGTKVLSSTTQELQITTDDGQSFKILEAGSDTITLQSGDGNITLASSGGGDVILDPTNGVVALKGTVTVYSGNKVISSDGNAIHIGDDIVISGSILSTGTPIISGSEQISSLGYATTGSNTFNGNLTVTGYIDTQELRTTYISSSILYRSGSTKFGDELTDNHEFTGSLLVSGSVTTTGNINVNSDGVRIDRNTSGEPYLFFAKDGVNRGSIYGVTGGGLRFFNNNDSQILTITGSYVGVGINNPQSLLHISGSDTSHNGLFITTSGTGNNFYPIKVGTGTSTDVFSVTNAARVGIGTVSPEAKLTINGGVNNVWTYSTNNSDQPGFVAANNTNTSTATNIFYHKVYGSSVSANVFGVTIGGWAAVGTDGLGGNGLIVGTFVSKPIIIGTGGTRAMYIDTSQRIGIGTDSPSYSLDVIDQINSEPYVQAQFKSTGGLNIGGILCAGTNQAHIRFLVGGSTWDGVGSKQWQIRAGAAAGLDDLRIYSWTAGGDVMTFKSNQNVGIGTNNPLGSVNNLGLQIDRGGHTTLLLGDGVNDGGVVQSSDNTKRIFMGANIYDDPSNSWSFFDGTSGFAAFDAIGGGSGLARILVGSPSDSDYASSNIFFEAQKSDGGSYLKLRTNTDNVIYLANNGYIGLGTDSPTAQLVLQTPGNTVDGTYYSSFTLKNTGTSTISRMRFDRGTSAKWGLTHWLNDSFRISNLDKNGTGDADDTTLTILNNNNIGLGTDNPLTHLHVSSAAHTKLRVSTTGTADASVEILGYDAGVHIGDPTNGNRWAIWNDGVSTSSSLKFGSYALGAWYVDASQTMTITSGGAVTKPLQPAWSVGLSSTQSFSTNVPTTINWNQSSGNDCFIQGNVTLNTGNGRITVPVAGKYMIFASIRTEAIGAAEGTNINLRRNGTTILRHYVGGAVNSAGSFMYIETRPIIVNCAANDYIDFYFDSITNDFNISATSNTVVRFGGFLMG